MSWIEPAFDEVVRSRPHARMSPASRRLIGRQRDELVERQLLEERVAERTAELIAVLELSRDLGSTLELGPLLNLILDRLQAVVPYTGAGILVIDGDRLYQRAHRSALPESLGLQVSYAIADWGDAWASLARGEPILIHDTHGASHAAELWRLLVNPPEQAPYRQRIRTCLWVPLVVRDRIIGVLAVTSDEVDGFTAHQAELAAAAASHAAVALENARLYEAARSAAALQERQRLARELHDSVSQILYAIALSAAAARRVLPARPQQGLPILDDMYQLAQAGLAEMRALIFELRPECLEQDGLVNALERQAAAVEARYKLVIDRCLGAEPNVALPIKEVVYRVCQEALQNAVNHARARRLGILLCKADGELRFELEDDGKGFSPTASFPGHLGLKSMRERAASVGGVLDIDSALCRGTRIRLQIPLEGELNQAGCEASAGC